MNFTYCWIQKPVAVVYPDAVQYLHSNVMVCCHCYRTDHLVYYFDWLLWQMVQCWDIVETRQHQIDRPICNLIWLAWLYALYFWNKLKKKKVPIIIVFFLNKVYCYFFFIIYRLCILLSWIIIDWECHANISHSWSTQILIEINQPWTHGDTTSLRWKPLQGFVALTLTYVMFACIVKKLCVFINQEFNISIFF
jgi:hypothetical protein